MLRGFRADGALKTLWVRALGNAAFEIEAWDQMGFKVKSCCVTEFTIVTVPEHNVFFYSFLLALRRCLLKP